MDITETLQFLDSLIFEQTGRHLNDLQKRVIQGVWEGKTYKQIGEKVNSSVSKVREAIFPLLKILSESVGEKITKRNFRYTIERIVIDREINFRKIYINYSSHCDNVAENEIKTIDISDENIIRQLHALYKQNDDNVAENEIETTDTSDENIIRQLHELYKKNLEQAREEYKAALEQKDEHIARIEEQYKILLEARQDRLDDQKKYIEHLKRERDYLKQENAQLQQFINSLPWKVSLELPQDNDHHQD